MYFLFYRTGPGLTTYAQKRRWLGTGFVLAYLVAILGAVWTWNQSAYLLTVTSIAPMLMYTPLWHNREFYLGVGLVLFTISFSIALAMGVQTDDKGYAGDQQLTEYYVSVGFTSLNQLIATIGVLHHLIFRNNDRDPAGTHVPPIWKKWASISRCMIIFTLVITWGMVGLSAYRAWTTTVYVLLALCPMWSLLNAMFFWRHWNILLAILLVLSMLCEVAPLMATIYHDMTETPIPELLRYGAYASVGVMQLAATVMVFMQFSSDVVAVSEERQPILGHVQDAKGNNNNRV